MKLLTNRNYLFRGDGGDGSGKNMLGHILMKVRAYLRGPNTPNM